MNLFIDTATNSIVQSALFTVPLNSLSFKRGDAARINVIFVLDGAEISADPDRQLTFGIKAEGDYDGAFLVSTSDFTADGTKYALNPSFNTDELNSLLADDTASAAGILEITWSDDEGASWTSTNTLPIVFNNDVCKGLEGSPTPSPSLLEWFATYRPAPIIQSSPPDDSDGFSLLYTLDDIPVYQDFEQSSDINGRAAYSQIMGSNAVFWQSAESRWVFNDWSNSFEYYSTQNTDFPVGPWEAADEEYNGFVTGPNWNGTAGKLGQFCFEDETTVHVCVKEEPYKWIALN